MKKRFFFLLALCLALLIPAAGACSHALPLPGYYESDATGHWQPCVKCGEKLNQSDHNFVIENNVTITQIRTYTDTCTVCGYVCKHPSTKTVTDSIEIVGTTASISYVGCSVCNVRLAAKVAEGLGGGTYYTSFSDALTAANASEAEAVKLTLLNPLTETNVTISRDMILDLGGCDWDASSNPDTLSPILSVKEGVTLTLCNNKPSTTGPIIPSIPEVISPAALSGTSSGGTLTAPENVLCLFVAEGGTLKATNVTLKGSVSNSGTITKEGTSSGGTFTGIVENTCGTISGGTFSGTVENGTKFSSGTISGGTFTGIVNNNCGAISGGTFTGTVENYSAISGGTFPGTVNNQATDRVQGRISGGTFTGTVNNTPRDPNSSFHIFDHGIVSGGDFSGATTSNIAKITFDLRGGTDSVAPQWRYGAAITKPDDPAYAGRAFLGWYNGETEGDFSSRVFGDLTLTAKWDCATAHGYTSGSSNCPDCGATLYVTRALAASGLTVGDTKISRALTAAQPRDTVKLLQNTDCDAINTIFTSCTLDLGGHTLYFPPMSSLAANGSPLTIADSSADKTGEITGSLRIWSTAQVTLTGGTYENIVALDDRETLSDLLAPGYGFRSGSVLWVDGNTTSLSHVTVALLPIQSVAVTPSTATLTYGETTNLPTFTATANLSEGYRTDSCSYFWKVDGEPQTGTYGSTFTLPAGLTGGSHTVSCQVSCDGTDLTSESVTVTVQPKPISIRDLTPKNRAYEPGNCVVDVEVDFSDSVSLTLGTDYTATGTVADDNAGIGKQVRNVTVKLLGDAAKNYDLDDDISQLVWLSHVNIAPIAHPDETVSATAKYGARSSVNLRPYSFDGNVTLQTITDDEGILASTPSLNGTTLQFQFRDDVELVGKTATLTLSVSDCTNYTDYTITLTLTASATDPGATPSRYAITLAETVHGTVTASVKKAQSGQTVTLTVTPGEGYELERLTVLNAKGRDLDLTEAGEGMFTFVMPRGAVTVEAAFRSTQPCTRAELVTSLHSAVGGPEPTGVSPFDDVPPTADCAKAVAWAFENDLVKGCGNNLFYPDNAISREEIATILYRYLQSQGSGFTGFWAFRLPFEDIEEISDWAWEAVCWCYKEGILEGFENQLTPKGECSRAQIIAMLHQLLAR